MPNREALNRPRDLNRSQTQLEPKLEKRLSSYVMAAGAVGAGVLTLALSAEAKVVYTPAYADIPSPGDFKLDLNGDGITDFGLVNGTELGHEGGQSLVPAVHGNAALGYAGSPQMFVSALPSGVKVGPGENFVRQRAAMATWFISSGFFSSRGPWKSAHDKYVGVAFLIDGETHYGWARISIKESKMLLTGYAYETTPNQPIKTGQTAEADRAGDFRPQISPSEEDTAPQSHMLGWLARGASGIVAWRRESENFSAGA